MNRSGVFDTEREYWWEKCNRRAVGRPGLPANSERVAEFVAKPGCLRVSGEREGAGVFAEITTKR
jgi:hypothetical protein